MPDLEGGPTVSPAGIIFSASDAKPMTAVVESIHGACISVRGVLIGKDVLTHARLECHCI